MNPEVTRLVEAVELARDGVIAAIEGLTEAQAQFRPGEGEWSVAEIAEHLYLTEFSGVSMMWAAVDGVRAGVPWRGDRPHRGKHIEEIIAETWRPREKAASVTTPRIGGPIPFWASSLRSLRPVLADLGEGLGSVPLADVVFPHFLSGPLDARQRLEFLRFHIERHLLQVRRVETSPGFPVSERGERSAATGPIPGMGR